MTKYRLMKMSDHPMDAGRVRVQAIQVHEGRSMHLAWLSNPATHRQFFRSRDAAIEFLTDRQPEAVIEEFDGTAWVDVNPFNAGRERGEAARARYDRDVAARLGVDPFDRAEAMGDWDADDGSFAPAGAML